MLARDAAGALRGDPSDLEPYGLTCEIWEPQPMHRADRHNELELNLLDSGSLTYLLGDAGSP